MRTENWIGMRPTTPPSKLKVQIWEQEPRSMPSRAELQPDMSTLEPVVNSVAPPSAPALPDTAPRSNPLLRTTLAPTQWQQPDAQRNFFQHGVPQIRISPLPASAQAGIGSAAQGQAANAIKPVSAL